MARHDDDYVFVIFVMRSEQNLLQDVLTERDDGQANRGLQALIAPESAKRLANLGGTEKGLRAIPRRSAV